MWCKNTLQPSLFFSNFSQPSVQAGSFQVMGREHSADLLVLRRVSGLAATMKTDQRQEKDEKRRNHCRLAERLLLRKWNRFFCFYYILITFVTDKIYLYKFKYLRCQYLHQGIAPRSLTLYILQEYK